MLFTFDSNGRIDASTNAIAAVSGGLPFDSSGKLVVANATDAPDYHHGPWPFDTGGSVAVDDGGTVVHWRNGLPYTAAGRIASDSSGAITVHHSGLPFSATGLSVGAV